MLTAKKKSPSQGDFCRLFATEKKNAAAIVNTICEKLEKDQLPLRDCCSQCYDNAAVMAGHVSGVQRRILDKNPNALFINCDNHGLNLACIHAASEETITISLFGTIVAIYNFFGASTNRWAEFKQNLGVSMHPQLETRWSARDEAVRTVNCLLDVLLQLLEDLTENGITADARSGAHALMQSMLEFELLTLLTFWNNLLSSIKKTPSGSSNDF